MSIFYVLEMSKPNDPSIDFPWDAEQFADHNAEFVAAIAAANITSVIPEVDITEAGDRIIRTATFEYSSIEELNEFFSVVDDWLSQAQVTYNTENDIKVRIKFLEDTTVLVDWQNSPNTSGQALKDWHSAIFASI